jgi:hypothetical protein
MLHRSLISVTVAACLLLAGCATQIPQAFLKDEDRVTATSNPVYLMTATIRNDYKNYYEPHLVAINVEKVGAGTTDTAGHINFMMDNKARWDQLDKESGNKYLIRMQLSPGQYEIVGLTSTGYRFPIGGAYFTPIHAKLDVKPGGVITYIGHVDATIRERKGDEFKAGPTVPLIDQAVVGASTGTFDVVISDAFDAEERVFRRTFAGLKDSAIQKSVLPGWDRALAQKWWEAH